MNCLISALFPPAHLRNGLAAMGAGGSKGGGALVLLIRAIVPQATPPSYRPIRAAPHYSLRATAIIAVMAAASSTSEPTMLRSQS